MRPALLYVLLLGACAAAKDKAPTPAPAPVSRSEQVIGAPDPNKQFPMEQLTTFGRTSSFQGKTPVNSNSFYIQQKFQPKGYDTHNFRTKGWWAGDFKFSTKEAATKGKYEVPNSGKSYETKSSPVKDAREVGKVAATRDLPDGNRPYLGKEAEKLKKVLDPNNLPRISNEMHELKTVDDVKALLNKN